MTTKQSKSYKRKSLWFFGATQVSFASPTSSPLFSKMLIICIPISGCHELTANLQSYIICGVRLVRIQKGQHMYTTCTRYSRNVSYLGLGRRMQLLLAIVTSSAYIDINPGVGCRRYETFD